MLMRTPFTIISIFAASVLLGACQQAAWKAGASVDDFKRDEQTCTAQIHDDAAAIKQCLRNKGWTVADFSAPVADDEPGATSSAATSTVTNATPLNSSVREAPAIETNNDVAKTSSRSNSSNTAAANAANTSTLARAPADPLQRQSVQTWWKAGAQAADFNIDQNACVEQLGDQHTPDYAQHLYTRALIGCLRARGWYAGHDPVYTPLR